LFILYTVNCVCATYIEIDYVVSLCGRFICK